jgi:putative hydrolase of the HAD superfamily
MLKNKRPFQDFKILTFDVVGTLIDFEAGVLDYIRSVDRSGALHTQRILQSYAVGEEAQHHAMPGRPFPEMLAPIYLSMARELDLPQGNAEAEGLRQSIPRWPAFPDSVAALKRLKARFRLVAMTNSDNWALDHFSAALGDPFDDLVTAEIAETCKPDPQFFAYARGRQSHLGYRLRDYLHVAQSQYHDIGVAKSLGYTTCWIERRRGQDGFGATPKPQEIAKPDFHFASLAELADAVERGT